MIRRVFALVLALTFWSIQTADAGVLHVSDDSVISIQADEIAQPTLTAADDGLGESEPSGPGTCTDSCPCHALHHIYLAMPQSEAELGVIAQVYGFSHDGRAAHHSAPLSRPPLA